MNGIPLGAGLWSVLLRLAGTALGLLVGVQLARYLGPAGLGEYAIAIAVVMLLASLAQFGLPTLAVRELAVSREQNDDRRANAIVSGFSFVTLANGILAALVLAGVARFILPVSAGLSSTLMIASVIVPLAALTALIGAQLQGLNHFVRGQSLEIVARPAVMSLLLFIAGAATGQVSPRLAVVIGAASFVAVLVLGAVWLRRALPASTGPWRRKGELLPWLRAAAPLSATDLLRQVDGAYGVLILGLLSTTDETGMFRVAASAVIVAAVPNSIMHVVMAPTMARLYARGDEPGLRRTLTSSARIMTSGLMAALVVLLLFGEWLLENLFGTEFVPAMHPLLVMALAHAVTSVLGLSGVFLAMTGRQRPLAVFQTIAMSVSLTSCLLLGGAFGALGAAWSMLLGYSTGSLLSWWKVRRDTGFDSSIFGLPPSLPANHTPAPSG